ncbi:phosphomannomutase [Bosea sp. (in: a-proteobacteria)]|uniref:phosphomannomutase n=1 Tax=Bosea sp. (in: a-proteobacteria) TaxID=1871050 RepID=UPI00261F2871|nr:phosphomannomutase [Bosea sp. (in: a-proteobacteria)]MCO5089968.1 phosphomannomutase [Bosea sp. (in: a-proteobacteria)]
MSSLKFGTSGLRGLVTELTGLPAYAHLRAFCAVLREDRAAGPAGEMLIGRDLRSSSPLIAAQCAQAIADAGLIPVDCGAVPTPALALAAMAAGSPAVMVTGSHIPDDRNGLKFYRATGEIDKADEARILARHEALALAAMPEVTARPQQRDIAAGYRARYIDFFGRALEGLIVGVYQHSSVGRDLLCTVLAALGATPVALGRSETFIPVDTEALRPEDEAQARNWAGALALAGIVSTDGDADRPLVADETGRFLRGDLVGALTARFLGADAIVTPVTSNSALDRPGAFGTVIRTRVGSPHVIAGMDQASAEGAGIVVGFEANGGVLLGSDVTRDGRRLKALPTRDAMLPILATLALARSEHRPLSAVAAQARFAAALSDRLPETPQERSAALIARLDAEGPGLRDTVFAAHGGVAARDRRDGLRLTLGDGATVHFRASGNAPELRVYVEAATPEGAQTLLAENLAFAAAQTR